MARRAAAKEGAGEPSGVVLPEHAVGLRQSEHHVEVRHVEQTFALSPDPVVAAAPGAPPAASVSAGVVSNHPLVFRIAVEEARSAFCRLAAHDRIQCLEVF